jgi:hypothetical protein
MYSNDGKNRTKTNEFALMNALKIRTCSADLQPYYYKMILLQIFML